MLDLHVTLFQFTQSKTRFKNSKHMITSWRYRKRWLSKLRTQ